MKIVEIIWQYLTLPIEDWPRAGLSYLILQSISHGPQLSSGYLVSFVKYEIQKFFGIWLSSSVQKQNCLIMIFIMAMEAKVCFGRTSKGFCKEAYQTIRTEDHRSVLWMTLFRRQHFIPAVNTSYLESLNFGASDGSACCSMAHERSPELKW